MEKRRTDHDREEGIRHAVEIAVRVGVIGLILLWVYDIVSPFIGPIVWGAIIAVAGNGFYGRLVGLCGNRRTLAALAFVAAALAFLLTPLAWLTGATVEWGQGFAAEVSDGQIDVPPPPENVRDWPVVGERLYGLWALANSNLQDALEGAQDQLKALGVWLLKSLASAGLGILQFMLSILIAGVFLARSEALSRLVNAFALRLAPASGARFGALAHQTVRGVAAGVVGVAAIQCVLAAIGFFAAGVPAAAVIALACLFVGIVQLPLAIPIVPVIVYVWFNEPTLAAVLFTIWNVPVMALDNILKPILMGRGVEAPMLVVFIGAIGGMAANGIVGLFTGAVILVVAYELFLAWLGSSRTEQE